MLLVRAHDARKVKEGVNCERGRGEGGEGEQVQTYPSIREQCAILQHFFPQAAKARSPKVGQFDLRESTREYRAEL